MASFVVTFHFYRLQASLRGNFVATVYTSSTSSYCLRPLTALFLVATAVVSVIKKLFLKVIVDTVKSTVFRVAMPCILVHTKVSDSLLGKMLIVSFSKISVLFYEAT